jgi:hypothetical protein
MRQGAAAEKRVALCVALDLLRLLQGLGEGRRAVTFAAAGVVSLADVAFSVPAPGCLQQPL